MSQRHQKLLMPVTDPELTAHARSERQRVRVELAKLARDSEYFDEPGVQYRAPRRHDPDVVSFRPKASQSQHWKQQFWKRRSAVRKARASAEMAAFDSDFLAIDAVYG